MTTIPDTATTVVRASHVIGPRQGHWTYDDYAALPEPEGFRYEIIDGVLYMAPAPIPEHERVGALIIGRFVAAVEDAEIGQVYISPDIDVGASTLRPDAVVVLNANLAVVGDKRIVGPPDLVVEIASASTAAYDRDADQGKMGAYARIGISEYWIVEPSARTIEIYALENDVYTALGTFYGTDTLPSRVLPASDLTASQFFPRVV